MTLIFWPMALVSLLCAMGVVLFRNPVYSVLSLILCFFSIAGHYLLLGATFLAAVHVIVYAGAIMVLFLFVIMMMDLNKNQETLKSLWITLVSTGVIAGFILLLALIGKRLDIPSGTLDFSIGSVKALGTALFNDYMIPFELSGILFLSAVVGAIFLSKKEPDDA